MCEQHPTPAASARAWCAPRSARLRGARGGAVRASARAPRRSRRAATGPSASARRVLARARRRHEVPGRHVRGRRPVLASPVDVRAACVSRACRGVTRGPLARGASATPPRVRSERRPWCSVARSRRPTISCSSETCWTRATRCRPARQCAGGWSICGDARVEAGRVVARCDVPRVRRAGTPESHSAVRAHAVPVPTSGTSASGRARRKCGGGVKTRHGFCSRRDDSREAVTESFYARDDVPPRPSPPTPPRRVHAPPRSPYGPARRRLERRAWRTARRGVLPDASTRGGGEGDGAATCRRRRARQRRDRGGRERGGAAEDGAEAAERGRRRTASSVARVSRAAPPAFVLLKRRRRRARSPPRVLAACARGGCVAERRTRTRVRRNGSAAKRHHGSVRAPARAGGAPETSADEPSPAPGAVASVPSGSRAISARRPRRVAGDVFDRALVGERASRRAGRGPFADGRGLRLHDGDASPRRRGRPVVRTLRRRRAWRTA